MATAMENVPVEVVDPEWEAFLAEMEAESAGSGRAGQDARLDYLLERLATLTAQIEENNEVARRRIEMIQAWQRSQNETLEKQAVWLRDGIAATAALYDYGAKKSRALPHGTLATG